MPALVGRDFFSLLLLLLFHHKCGKWQTYLEVQDDRPNESERELWVPVDDVLPADVDDGDLLVAEEPQRRLHVLDGVEAHAAALAGLQGGEGGGEELFIFGNSWELN